MAKKTRIKVIGLFLLAAFIFSACGQKRALYLPEEPTVNTTTPGSEQPAESIEQGTN